MNAYSERWDITVNEGIQGYGSDACTHCSSLLILSHPITSHLISSCHILSQPIPLQFVLIV
jgi:hypothetical protein